MLLKKICITQNKPNLENKQNIALKNKTGNRFKTYLEEHQQENLQDASNRNFSSSISLFNSSTNILTTPSTKLRL